MLTDVILRVANTSRKLNCC